MFGSNAQAKNKSKNFGILLHSQLTVVLKFAKFSAITICYTFFMNLCRMLMALPLNFSKTIVHNILNTRIQSSVIEQFAVVKKFFCNELLSTST